MAGKVLAHRLDLGPLRPHALPRATSEARLTPPDPAPAAVRPGALSALLADIVRAPGGAPAWESGLKPGERVGRFEILAEIGRGGFGVVYEARDVLLGRSVAFKAVRAGDEAALREERLQREAESAARLSHPSIVTLYDVGRCEHGPYLVLELHKGRSLAERLAQGPLSVREALRIALRVAGGLAHAHGRGVVHRDLTPGNVFLCDDGQVKVLDFGMAHAFGQPRIAGGTPAYMAPEQWRGAPEDERTDVFALGVMLYRMLSGALPFEEDLGRSVVGPRPAPVLDVPEIPPLGPLVARMLEKDPVLRPRSGAEVLAALSAFDLELNRTPSGPAASSGPRALGVRPRGPRRRPWLWAGAVLLVLWAAAFSLLLGRERPAGPRVTVAVADFVNRTGDPDLDGLSGLLITSLEQSQRLSVLTRVRMLDLLHQLGRTEADSVDEALGREVALSAGARALVLASVRRFDEVYAIEVKVLEPARSEYLFTLQEEGRGKGSVPGMIDRISARTRERLREPAAEVQAKSVRVADATTSSFSAYQHYFRGDELKEAIRYEEAIAEYRRALSDDPDFALPHYRIAYLGEFTGMGEAARQAEMEAALRGIDRVPAKERLLLEAWKAHLDGQQQAAHALYARAAEAYPQDKEVLFLAGDLYLHEERYAEGLPYFQRAAALDPLWVPALMHLTDSYMFLGQAEELGLVARGWVARAPSSVAYGALAYAEAMVGRVEEGVVAAQKAFDLDASPYSRFRLTEALILAERYAEAEALARQGLTAGSSPLSRELACWPLIEALAYQGRRRDALRAVEEAPEDPKKPGMRLEARLELLLGDPDRGAALEAAARFEAISRDSSGLGHQTMLPVMLAMMGDLVGAARLSPGLPAGGAERKLYEAVVAWKTGGGDRALELLREVTRPPRPSEQRAAAEALVGEVAFEAGRYREVVEAAKALRVLPSGLWRTWGYPLTLYRAAQAQEKLGEVREAKASLDHLLRLWAGADADLPLLAEARAMRKRLGPDS